MVNNMKKKKKINEVVVANTKDGEVYEMEYFDENGNQIFPQDGELYNYKGLIAKYSEEKKSLIFS